MKVSKISLARVKFAQIVAEGYVVVKSPRQDFINWAMENNMSKICASRYYENIQNEYKDGKVYEAPVVELVEEVVEVVEVELERWFVELERWFVEVDSKEVESFKSRAAAREFAKEVNGKVKDRNAK